MKMKKLEKRVFRDLALLTYFTGVNLFIFSHWIRVETAIGEQHHSAEFWLRLAHSALTYGIVLAAGYLLKTHILPGLRSPAKRNLASGVTGIGVFIILVATAVSMLYAGEGQFREITTWGHSIVGLALPVLLVVHRHRPDVV